MLTTKRSRTIVGLDIEADSIAAAEVSTNGSASLGRTGIAPIEPGLFHDGEITDAARLADALKALFAEHKLPRNVRVGIANQRVIIRTLRLPVLEGRDEIKAAVRFQAADQIPMSLDEAFVDWQVLDDDLELRSSGQMDVVVVAARHEAVNELTRTLTMAGLKPVGIDSSAFAMIRALGSEAASEMPTAPAHDMVDAYPADPAMGETAVLAGARLLCNFGDVLNLAVARGSSCLFSRVSPSGMEGIAQRLAEARGLTLEHAHMWLVHVGARRPLEEIEGDPETVAATRETLIAGLKKLAGEMRLSLDYYGAQEGAIALDEIVICGAGSMIDGVAEQTELEVGCRARTAMPAGLAHMSRADAARLTLPYGLGLEE